MSRIVYARLLPTPTRSVFLFGPRGTGKTTWLRDRFPNAATYDLLDTGEALRLSKRPDTLYRELAALPADSWVVIDEVQKVPELLNEVHRLIESRGLRFVLSGSSTRKLRRRGVNLLAGRAINTTLFPLVSAELGVALGVEQALSHGTLPMAVAGESPRDYLRTYAETYLVQEVQAEALTRNLGAFARFLEIAARQNAQATNATSIARDAGIDRRTVQSHFGILIDTLIGCWLPPWKLRSATKQVQQSKFYFFDSGVARALSGRLPYPPITRGARAAPGNARPERGPRLPGLLRPALRAALLAELRRGGGRPALRDRDRLRGRRDQGVLPLGLALQPRLPAHPRAPPGPRRHLLRRLPGRAGRLLGRRAGAAAARLPGAPVGRRGPAVTGAFDGTSMSVASTAWQRTTATVSSSQKLSSTGAESSDDPVPVSSVPGGLPAPFLYSAAGKPNVRAEGAEGSSEAHSRYNPRRWT